VIVLFQKRGKTHEISVRIRWKKLGPRREGMAKKSGAKTLGRISSANASW
jgi:hypothetical protein